MSDLPTCLCGAPLVLPDRAGYCCSDQACGMFDPDGDLTIGDWRHINAIVARKVTEATNRLAAEIANRSGGWVLKRAVEAEAERDRLREALTELRPLVEEQRDDLLRDFTTIGSGNDRATMDSQEAEIVAEWDAGLALIDAALAEPPHA